MRRRVAVAARDGLARARVALVPVLLASLAAGAAWFLAADVLGHPSPFFAPVSAWVALGFSANRRPRRVGELAVGVAVGVLLGDLLVHLIGAGALQVGLVLAVAALVARVVDRGDLLATQAGVQAIVIVGLPAAQVGSAVTRWTDALVGGAVALVVAALSPQDPRREVHALAGESCSALAQVLRLTGHGLREADAGEVEEALLRGRTSGPALDRWRSVAQDARHAARVSASHRRRLPELARLLASAVAVDRAMRTARVVARRAQLVVGTPALDPLPELLEDLADGVDRLGRALSSGADTAVAREHLRSVAGGMDPYRVDSADLQAQGLVLLLRSVVVDLLEAADEEPGPARAALPTI
ncbi:hypothetical protein GXB85_00235 [Cellulomonas sp. APG4]|nr:FUSC family protein [Cellulomonas sp. APG4]NCT89384.1 hypothetical protein [Cellulomonas sp. APG4]